MAQEGREHERETPPLVRGVRGSSPRKFCIFNTSMCVFNGFCMRLEPDFSHDFLIEKIFLGA